MYLGRVVGTCVATQRSPGLDGSGKVTGAPFIAADTVSAGPGELVFLVGAREASLALEQPFVPIDAAIVGLVDEVHLADGAKGFLRGRDDVRGAP